VWRIEDKKSLVMVVAPHQGRAKSGTSLPEKRRLAGIKE